MVRCRYYHVPLDPAPSWGSVLGFGMENRTMEWVQSADWWQLMLVSFGGVMSVNGTPTPFRPRSLLVIPAAARCRLERMNGDNITQHWLKFRPSQDGRYVASVPQVKAMGEEYEFLDLQFRASLDLIPFCRGRLEVMGWNLLWSVSENAATSPEDPILASVEQALRANLATPPALGALAQSAGISLAKLTRIFREQYGQSPTDYIRTLRMQQACGMLINTNRPIKEVAVRVGIPDLQRFNKLIRDTFGCSPRVLRAEQPSMGVHVVAADAKGQRQCLLNAEPSAYETVPATNGARS